MKSLNTTLLSTILIGSLSAAAAQAAPAVYTDNTLSIDTGAVISAEGNAFYGDIQLSRDDEGKFTITGAQSQPLVQVDSVDVAVMESFPVQVSLTVAGNKSVPCVELHEPAVVRAENTFTVVLAETVLGPAETCIAVIDPFETSIALDVKGLEAGTYTVDVNGIETEFTLDTDNF